MSDEQWTCEQLIDGKLADLISEVKAYRRAEDEGDEHEDYNDPLEALGIDKEILITLTLSWGGPADYIELRINPNDHSITEIYYIYQDWGDGARRKVTGEAFDVLEAELSYLAESWEDVGS